MDETTLELFKSLGLTVGQVVIVIGLGYLLKKVFESKLSNQLEQYKKELQLENQNHQLELDKQFEQYRSELEISRLENQIKFGKLHEDRALVIKKLYSKLRILEGYMYSWTLPLQQVPNGENYEDYIEKKRIDFNKSFSDFNDYYIVNAIFFEEKTCKIIDNIIKQVSTNSQDFQEKDYLKAMGVTRGEVANQAMLKASTVFNKVRNELPEVRKMLEHDLRLMLGVSALTNEQDEM